MNHIKLVILIALCLAINMGAQQPVDADTMEAAEGLLALSTPATTPERSANASPASTTPEAPQARSSMYDTVKNRQRQTTQRDKTQRKPRRPRQVPSGIIDVETGEVYES